MLAEATDEAAEAWRRSSFALRVSRHGGPVRGRGNTSLRRAIVGTIAGVAAEFVGATGARRWVTAPGIGELVPGRLRHLVRLQIWASGVRISSGAP